MKRTVACIIARTISKRLPLKVLRNVTPQLSLLEFLIKRLKGVGKIDEIYICTSNEMVDDILEDVAGRNGVKIYRGDSLNILERMISVGDIEDADYLIRITGDNPLTSFEYIETQINLMEENGLDYIRVVDVPIGSTAEVMTFEALLKCSKMMNPNFSEYLMLYLFEPNEFTCGVLKPFSNNYSTLSITVDTPEDLLKIKKIVSDSKKEPEQLYLKDIVEILRSFPQEARLKLDEARIKLPENKSMPFHDFIKDMERRKNGSINFLMS